jgi:hypothetical protein
MLNATLRSRSFSACLHAGLWVLLLLAIIGIGGTRPLRFSEAEADPAAVNTPVPMSRLEKLFAPGNWPRQLVDPAGTNQFVTTHFIPTTPPPPPPPTTRKVEVTYQGFYRAAEGPQQAFLRVADALIRIPVGGVVTTNLFLIEVSPLTATLTNSAAQTNLLKLNTKQEIEVPLK